MGIAHLEFICWILKYWWAVPRLFTLMEFSHFWFMQLFCLLESLPLVIASKAFAMTTHILHDFSTPKKAQSQQPRQYPPY
ncbi:hypothetical protein BV372_09345 [Nostoc sp. T09]|nr:hypothetical protein BV372_09345 [Nostoc sp. T09]